MTPQELKFFQASPDFEGPMDKDFKKVVRKINVIPLDQLYKAWGVGSSDIAKKVIKKKAKYAFKKWIMNVKKLSPKMRGIMASYPSSIPIIYYVFMRRMIGRKETFKIFKRFFKADKDLKAVSDTPDTIDSPAIKKPRARNKQRSGKWSKPDVRNVSDEVKQAIKTKRNEKKVGADPSEGPPKRVKVKPTIAELESKIADKMPSPPDFKGQVEIARDVINQHKDSLEAKLNALKEMAPQGADVKGRVKELESAVGKIARKPKYGTAANLQDVTGTRVVMDTIDEVIATVNKIRAKYTIVEEDNYISEALDGYRSHHLIAKDENGLDFEIQVRTKNQNTWADWAHDMYKPVNPAQEEAMADSSEIINDFKMRMSAYYFAKDNPTMADVVKPECPAAVMQSFGCPI
jgi:ppGpp synthetase/RelA/SpoT-type nucleotidyltranferase